MTMTRFSLTATAAAALLALSLPAAAAPFMVEQNGSTAHGDYGHSNATLSKGGNVSAGAFDVSADAFGGDFAAWCLDLANHLNLPSSYEITSTPFTGNPISTAVQSTVKALFDTAYSTLNLNNSGQSAGFQLALWEILTETKTDKKGNLVYNVSGSSNDKGVFYATNTSSSAINAANGFLGNLNGTKTGDYTLTFLQSTDGKQSLVTAAQPVPPPTPSEVPLPAAGLLLFGALGGLGVVARRRKSTDA